MNWKFASFTITNGYANQGGGVYTVDSDIILNNIIFSNNIAYDDGGAGLFRGRRPVFTNVLITGNTASSGGGLYFTEGAMPIIDSSIISDNIALGNYGSPHDGNGGGILIRDINYSFNSGITLEITNSDISNNSAIKSGGGIFIHNDGNSYGTEGVLIENSNIINNSVGENSDCQSDCKYGAGIAIERSNPQIYNSNISNNTGARYGGGIYLWSSEITMDSLNVVSGNLCDLSGAGIYVWGSDGVINSTLFTGNEAGDRGGAIYTGNDNDLSINQVTVSGNSAQTSGSGINTYQSGFNITNSIFWPDKIHIEYGNRTYQLKYSNYYEIDNQENGQIDMSGSISINPIFIDPSNGDFSLNASSACIDSGSPDCQDFDGSICDMGFSSFNQNPGCTDPYSSNYNSDANFNDGSCVDGFTGFTYMGNHNEHYYYYSDNVCTY